MRVRTRAGVVALATVAFVGVSSCTGDQGPMGPEGPQGPQGPQGPAGPAAVGIETFTANLTGGAEVPAVNTPATGTATITRVGDLLIYRVDVSNITNATAAHIHGPATTAQTAPVRVDLYIPPAGTTFTGSGTLAQGVAPAPRGISADSVMVLLRNGNAYVNVHTTANAPGEIRGQVVRQ